MINESKLNEIIIANISSRLVNGKENAVNDIVTARNKVDRKHEVNLYLIHAQLSAYRNYQVAYQLTHGTMDPPPTDKATMEAQYNLYDLKQIAG